MMKIEIFPKTAARLMAAGLLVMATGGTAAVLATELPRASSIQKPVLFEDHSNGQGQRYVARGPGYMAILDPSGMTLGLQNPAAGDATSGDDVLPGTLSDLAPMQPAGTYRWLREELVGANTGAVLSGEHDTGGRTSYFQGSDPALWRTNLSMYSEVSYLGVYQGVDVRCYDRSGRLERDFIVHPGGLVESIELSYPEALGLEITADGTLEIETLEGLVRQSAPEIYQVVAGARTEIAGRFVLRGDNRAGFEVPQYDEGVELIIDPVLEYSTYIGGPERDDAGGVAVDAQGNIFVTGFSVNPPTSSFPMAEPSGNAIGPTNRASIDAFVTKYSPSGQVIYSAIIGGPGVDAAFTVKVTASGSAVIAGQADPGFPLVKTIQQSGGGVDGFVSVLSPDGTSLLFSTYIGGNGTDFVLDLALDTQEDVIIVGFTDSTTITFNTTNPTFDNTANGGSDGFLAEIDFNESNKAPFFRFKTFLGTAANDSAFGVGLDNGGNMYVTGFTDGTTKFQNAPDPRVQSTPGGGGRDAFVISVNEGGGGATYFTFLGGGGVDEGRGIAVNSLGEAIVAGSTASTNFPTSSSALQRTYGGGTRDAFVVKINAEGSRFGFSSYLGGSGADDLDSEATIGGKVALTEDGDIIVVGRSDSANFKITPGAVQLAKGGAKDAFLTKIKGDGTSLLYSTWLGGNLDDASQDVAWQAGRAYVVGETRSTGNNTGFPVTSSAAQLSAPGAENGFLSVVMIDDVGGGGQTAHPADMNGDFKIGLSECINYAVAFGAQTPWPEPPSPPSLSYVINGCSIFGLGEGYTDNGGAAPARWVSTSL